uniref:Uncharacterized protein n=1 Tax=Anguilla anguilla TaxID=7936 RepID=A0A0E9PTG0_ANGAN
MIQMLDFMFTVTSKVHVTTAVFN